MTSRVSKAITKAVKRIVKTTTTVSTTSTTELFEDDYDDVDEGQDVFSITATLAPPSAAPPPQTPASSPFSSENAPFLWTLTVLYLVNIFAVFLLNLIALQQLMVKRNKRIPLVTNPYVCCLLVADVLWPIINVPFNLVQTWTPYWHFGRITCKLFPVIQMCFPDAISLTLCLIAIERYISVIHPFRPNPLLKKSISIAAIAIVWLIPISLNSILAFTHDMLEFEDGNYVCSVVMHGDADDEAEAEAASFTLPISSEFVESYKVVQSAIVLLVIPGILFPFCYGQIVFKVFTMKKSAQRSTALSNTLLSVNQNSNSSDSHLATLAAVTNKRLERAERRRRSVTLLSIVIQVVHFTCWTPIVVFQLIHFFHEYPSMSQTEFICLRLFILLASANPALNSLLYTAALYREKHGGLGGLQRPSQAAFRGSESTTHRSSCQRLTLGGGNGSQLSSINAKNGLSKTFLNNIDEEVFEPEGEAAIMSGEGGAATFILARLTRIGRPRSWRKKEILRLLRKQQLAAQGANNAGGAGRSLSIDSSSLEPTTPTATVGPEVDVQTRNGSVSVLEPIGELNSFIKEDTDLTARQEEESCFDNVIITDSSITERVIGEEAGLPRQPSLKGHSNYLASPAISHKNNCHPKVNNNIVLSLETEERVVMV